MPPVVVEIHPGRIAKTPLSPRDRSIFKVYTINADDHGKGSNGVDITWPV